MRQETVCPHAGQVLCDTCHACWVPKETGELGHWLSLPSPRRLRGAMPFQCAEHRLRVLAVAVVLAVAAVGLLSLAGCTAPAKSATVTLEELDAHGGGRIPDSPEGLEKIDHFIFIIQENRSFDSYFGT